MNSIYLQPNSREVGSYTFRPAGLHCGSRSRAFRHFHHEVNYHGPHKSIQRYLKPFSGNGCRSYGVIGQVDKYLVNTGKTWAFQRGFHATVEKGALFHMRATHAKATRRRCVRYVFVNAIDGKITVA